MGIIHWPLNYMNLRNVIPITGDVCNTFIHLFLDGVSAVETMDEYGHLRNDTVHQSWLEHVACCSRIEHDIDSTMVKITLFDYQLFTSIGRKVICIQCSDHFVWSCGYRFFFHRFLFNRFFINRFYFQGFIFNGFIFKEVYIRAIVMISGLVKRWSIFALVTLLNVMPNFLTVRALRSVRTTILVVSSRWPLNGRALSISLGSGTSYDSLVTQCALGREMVVAWLV